jgi:hypothetical protein
MLDVRDLAENLSIAIYYKTCKFDSIKQLRWVLKSIVISLKQNSLLLIIKCHCLREVY